MKTPFKATLIVGIFWLISTSNQSFAQMLSPMELPNNNFCSIDATITNNDSVCRIVWGYPWSWYYDDGSYNELVTWISTGGEFVVKFEFPAGLLRLIGAEIFVGDGSFPTGIDFLGNDFLLVVYDDDGEEGLPGTLLDSATITVDNYDWVSCEGLDVSLEDSVFYLGMRQILPYPEAAPIGIDTDLPTKNYSYMKQPFGETWQLLLQEDFMIRALTCVDNKHYGYKAQKDYFNIIVLRASDFDPTIGETPDDGVLTVLDSTIGLPTSYDDTSFVSLPVGYYAYGLKKFNSIDSTFSNWNYSNTVLHSVGIVENEFSKTAFIIYPNPAKSKLTIDFLSKNNLENTTIEIIDINGKTVLKAKPLFSSTQIDIKGIKTGLYLVKVQNHKTLNTKRLIIQ